MAAHLEYFRSHAPGFEDAYMMLSAPQIGVRHARRLKGVDAVLRSRWPEGTPLPDEVAVTPAVSPKFPNISIPYGALVPETLDGLLAVGRHISCDRNSHGFMREIPQCWQTGQAAGVAAAIAVKQGIEVRAVDIDELQRALLAQGVYLRPRKKRRRSRRRRKHAPERRREGHARRRGRCRRRQGHGPVDPLRRSAGRRVPGGDAQRHRHRDGHHALHARLRAAEGRHGRGVQRVQPGQPGSRRDPKVKAFSSHLQLGFDPHHPKEMGLSEEMVRFYRKSEAETARLGVQILNTCTPYQVGNVPTRGEHCAWMESSAVVYCNSVLGGRTNTEGRESVGAAMLTCRIPDWGFHRDDYRRGTLGHPPGHPGGDGGGLGPVRLLDGRLGAGAGAR
jgi:hypothetical protein